MSVASLPGLEQYANVSSSTRTQRAAAPQTSRAYGADTVTFSAEALARARAAQKNTAAAEDTATAAQGSTPFAPVAAPPMSPSSEASNAADAAAPSAASPAPATVPEEEPRELRIVDARDQWGRRVSGVNTNNMQELTDQLAMQLQDAFQKAGLPSNPPVSFQLVNGKFQATGSRNDLDAIEALVNNNPAIKDTMESLAYVTEELSSFVQQKHISFSREYQASSNPKAVVDKYAHLFAPQSGPPGSATLHFNGTASSSWQGKPVSAEYFRNHPEWTGQ